MASRQNQQTVLNRQNELKRKNVGLLQQVCLALSVRFWSLKLPIIARTNDLDVILDKSAPMRWQILENVPAQTIVRRIRKTVRKPLLMRSRPCLREGLLLFRFLTMAGFPATLHFGVDRKSIEMPTLSAHCWVVLNEQTYLPPAEGMVEITRYAAEQLCLQSGKLKIIRLSTPSIQSENT